MRYGFPVALITRNIERELRDILSVSRAGAILGPRQAGKSTLAKQLQRSGLIPNYYSLDDEGLRSAARADPDGFIADLPRPAAIDEVQRAPDLLLAIKQTLDAEPNTPGQFLLTGSANLLTIKRVADALPGRVEYVNLWPLSQGEIHSRRETFVDGLMAGTVPQLHDEPRGRSAHAEGIVAGGFPEARTRDTARQRRRYFESYVHGVVSRDLPDISDVRVDPVRVEQLLRVLAARTTGMANYSRTGAEIGLTEKTTKAHIELLEQLFLVMTLQPWSTNLSSRQVKTPKVLLTDTGLAAALIGVDERRYSAPDQGTLAGMLLETFVTMEIVKQTGWSDVAVRLFFYRDHDQREIDLVMESASGDIACVEVKAAASVDTADTKGLRFLRDKLGDRFKAGAVVYSGAHTVALGDRLWAVPLAGLWA
jgi:predicted AAA+ superfamily ATPase